MTNKPLSIEEKTRIVNSAVVSFRYLKHSLTDLVNLIELYPEFMGEHYTLPDDPHALLQRSLDWCARAEANLTSRKLLILESPDETKRG